MGISPNTVLGAIRAEAATVPAPAPPARIQDLEVDEFWSFVGTKAEQRWTWYGFDRQCRQIVALVNGRRTDGNCRRLYEQLQGCRITHWHTDDWQSYGKVLPPRRHQVSKAGTRHIERQNLNFRTHVKRLHRRTICFSKSTEMHDAVLRLYAQHANSQQHQI